VEPERALGNLVQACIQTRELPVMGKRDAALAAVADALDDLAIERIGGVSFDGLNPWRVWIDEAGALRIEGFFYTLEPGSPALPMTASLSVESGAVSAINVASRDSFFALPQNDRQFVRGFERAVWRHRIDLRLS
jgi:hypothetical protein